MKTTDRLLPLFVVLALAASGCAYMPKENVRLEEARAAQARILVDRDIALHAPNELRRAEEAFERAVAASNTLEDPALVDHLAYVARQRATIAAEVAQRIAADRAAAGRLRQTAGRPQ